MRAIRKHAFSNVRLRELSTFFSTLPSLLLITGRADTRLIHTFPLSSPSLLHSDPLTSVIPNLRVKNITGKWTILRMTGEPAPRRRYVHITTPLSGHGLEGVVAIIVTPLPPSPLWFVVVFLLTFLG